MQSDGPASRVTAAESNAGATGLAWRLSCASCQPNGGQDRAGHGIHLHVRRADLDAVSQLAVLVVQLDLRGRAAVEERLGRCFGLGALIATLCIFLPSSLLVVGLAPFFGRLAASPQFQKIIRGVLCSFVGLLISVTLRFALQVQWDVIHALLAVGALVALLRIADIFWVVLAEAAFSVGLIR